MTVETLSINILGKSYQVACPSEEKDDLVKAAAELDARMREIRQGDSIIGVERIAVMAALNLADELLKSKQQASEINQNLADDLHGRIDKLLS